MKQSIKSRSLLGRWQVAGALVGLAGSVIAVVSGGLLSVSGWLVTNPGISHWLSTAGSVLFLLTIPLIILAAFCLDWVDNDPPRRAEVAHQDHDDEL